MVDRHWGFAITHVPRKHALSEKDVSIMAGLVECRDLLRRIRCETTDYDDCDSQVDEIIEACQAIDRAIAGFVERNLMVSWAWDKERDKEMILLEEGK